MADELSMRPSLASVEGSALQSAYSASKFAIRGLTQSAAKELAKDHITVMLIILELYVPLAR